MEPNWPSWTVLASGFTRQLMREILGRTPARPAITGLPWPRRRMEPNWWPCRELTIISAIPPAPFTPRRIREPLGFQTVRHMNHGLTYRPRWTAPPCWRWLGVIILSGRSIPRQIRGGPGCYGPVRVLGIGNPRPFQLTGQK